MINETLKKSNWKFLNDKELPICRLFNQLIRVALIKWSFVKATRLGNGIFWYALFALLPLIDPVNGWVVSLIMLVAGTLGLISYKTIKHLTHRARPYINYPSLVSPDEPLDFYSFPSGHTLHAFSLTNIISLYYPPVTIALWSFAGLIAISRIGLGHHYPSDVIIGGGIGLVISSSVLNLV